MIDRHFITTVITVSIALVLSFVAAITGHPFFMLLLGGVGGFGLAVLYLVWRGVL